MIGFSVGGKGKCKQEAKEGGVIRLVTEFADILCVTGAEDG